MIEKNSNVEQVLNLTADVVSAYVSNNQISSEELMSLIENVCKTFKSLQNHAYSKHANLVPAVPIKKSVTPDHIICLEDGKKLKMIKRHLKAVYNMTVEEYKERWGLPADYPVVAPNYAKQRSDLAKVIGLGTTGRRKKKAS